MAVIKKYKMDSGPVPTLIVGEHVLIGSDQIPAEFPDLVESYLAQGGVSWPDIPGLQSVLDSLTPKPTPVPTVIAPTPSIPLEATVQPTTTLTPALEIPLPLTTTVPTLAPSNPLPQITPGLTLLASTPLKPWDSWRRDPVGNSFSILVLIGMLLALLAGVASFSRQAGETDPGNPSPWIPLLCLAGIFVAGYLAYVETQHTQAFCGPVGDCNAVQQSKYAVLFGVLPVGVLGLAGYAGIFIAWWFSRKEGSHLWILARLALLTMTTFGLLFSIYLTFLEPFVIGATCAWCLASASITTMIFWLSLPLGRSAINQFFR